MSDEARGVDESVYAAQVDGLAMARATTANVETTLALYETADAWMRSRGINPGEPPIPQRDIVTSRIERGMIWLALSAGGDVAAPLGAIVPKWEDDGTWRDVPGVQSGDALYVHGLVSSREPEGRGVGLLMLRWAEQVAANAGRAHLRLDCVASNPALRGYYERAGFTHRGDFARPDITLSRYEKRVDEGDWS
ncbi:MAG: GNAT family N-acetyltransferase [Ktedonobacterales bacterium]